MLFGDDFGLFVLMGMVLFDMEYVEMVWVWLLIVGLLEVVWVVGLKLLDGFMKFGLLVFMIVMVLVSFGLFVVVMC